MWLVKYLIALLLILIPATSLADTHNAASCSSADVATAITASANGDIVTIPVGTCTWTSGITVTKNITIQGAGYANTVITRNGTAFKLTDTSTRITGIGFSMSSGDKQIDVNGGSGWRIDHCQFTNPTTSSLVSIYVNSDTSTSAPYGLIDNNDFQGGRITTSLASNATEARAIWAAEHPFGSADTTGLHTVYIEDNTFTKTWDSNCIDGSAYTGGYVARYNAVTGSQFHVHSLQDATNRGAKAWEMYGNTFTTSSSRWAAIWARSGTGYIFNNTISGSYSYNVIFDNIRSYQSILTAGQCNSSSDWDGNDVGVGNGWPCRDQIGRGKDTSLWTTENPYPAQASQPAYLWSNFDTGVAVTAYIHNSCGAWILADRDYYEPGATNGVRCGTLANIPETCTTGQAYWATNQSCTDMTGMVGVNPSTPISGSLYKCTSTDTWTESYTPLVYPHPLREESGGDTTAPTVSAVYIYAATSVINFSEPITSTSGAAFTIADLDSAMTLTCPAVETGATTMTCTNSRTVYQSEGNGSYGYTGTKVVDASSNALATINTSPTATNMSTEVETPPAVALKISSHTGAVVTTSPSGISCGSTCSADFEKGTTVTVSGYCLPNYEGFTITSDKDCNTETGAVAMSAAKECAAYCTKIAADAKVGSTGLPGQRMGTTGLPAHKRY